MSAPVGIKFWNRVMPQLSAHILFRSWGVRPSIWRRVIYSGEIPQGDPIFSFDGIWHTDFLEHFSGALSYPVDRTARFLLLNGVSFFPFSDYDFTRRSRRKLKCNRKFLSSSEEKCHNRSIFFALLFGNIPKHNHCLQMIKRFIAQAVI